MQDITVDIGESEIAACVAICQPLMIKAHEMQQCGMQVVYANGIFLGRKAKFVRAAVRGSAADAAARQADRKAVMIVIATELGLIAAQFDTGRSTKFAAPHDQRFVEHAALFEIAQQSRDRLIDLSRQFAVILRDVFMIIPRLTGTMPELNHANAPFEQPPRDQRLAAVDAAPIEFLNVLRFVFDLEGIEGRRLHAECQFKRLDAGFQTRIVPLATVRFVQLL